MCSKIFFTIIYFGIIVCLSGCSSNQIIEKSEYQSAIDFLKTDNVGMALNTFPKKESQHFITLLEKVYLQLIDTDADGASNTPEFEQLMSISRSIEFNEKTSISNEIDQLFFIKTNEGYYPANHEIFWLHLILGLTFVKKKEIKKARVEAKRISELFARVDMSGRPFYDNASIRMLSAALWILCSEKENALVDIRNIKDSGVPATLIGESSTIDWDITFKGVGAYPETDTTSFSNKISGFKAIQFKATLNESVVRNESSKGPLVVYPSQPWHSENLVRNEEFKDVIQKSKYMSRMFKSELEYQSLNILTSIAAGTVLVAGVAVGVAIVGGGLYLLASQANSGDLAIQLIGAGVLVGGSIYEQGSQFYHTTQNKIQSERHDYQDVSRFYRYVRFIPDYFVLNKQFLESDRKQAPFIKVENPSGKIRIFFQP